jgi:mannose-6-phosphate isomerase-like protein (cupin superfamily)
MSDVVVIGIEELPLSRIARELVGEELEVGAGQVVVVPAGRWHGFVNSGDGPLKQIDIHVSPRFQTEWR